MIGWIYGKPLVFKLQALLTEEALCDISYTSFSYRLYIFQPAITNIHLIARTAGNNGLANKDLAIKDDWKRIHAHKE